MTRNGRMNIAATLTRWTIVAGMTGIMLGGTPMLAQSSKADSSSPAPAVGSSLHDPGFATIMVLARGDRDSVVLRWAPSTPHGWRVANRTGYVVERRSGEGEYTRLTPDTLHPWLAFRFIEEMQRHPSHPYLGLVLNALWADSLLLEPFGADTLQEHAERNSNLFGYSLFAADNDPYIADALGLRYVDHKVKAGAKYTYRIRLNEPRDYRIDPGEVQVEVRKTKKAPPPAHLAADAKDGRIALRWNAPEALAYTGYVVLRSDNGGKAYKQLNPRPIVILTPADTSIRAQGGYTDSAVVYEKAYRYRVKGITAFGELGDAAEVHAIMHDETPPPAPVVKNPRQVGDASVKLEWEMPAPPKNLAGFIISRSSTSDSNYHDLTRKHLPKTAREYVDNHADRSEPYYRVTSVDAAGRRTASFPLLSSLVDTVAPSAPTGLTGSIDSAGVVHLSWHANTEGNILGYRVLRANDSRHEFTQLTGRVQGDTTYCDTVDVKTLTPGILYTVAAVNVHFLHSVASAPLVLHRPDRTPPEAPVFSDVVVSDSTVTLRWAASRSADVQSHLLYRRISSKEPWGLLATLGGGTSDYVDHAVEQRTMYEYRLEAMDSSGLKTPAVLTVQGRPFDNGVRAPASGLAATFQPKDQSVVLTWAYAPAKKEKGFFVIYRAKNGGPLNRYRSVGAEGTTFTDKEIAIPSVYEYAIKFVADDGAESPLSERTRILIPRPGE